MRISAPLRWGGPITRTITGLVCGQKFFIVLENKHPSVATDGAIGIHEHTAYRLLETKRKFVSQGVDKLLT